ncbi:MAG: endolytic transglycosylase MltG [Desulfotignum sp.]
MAGGLILGGGGVWAWKMLHTPCSEDNTQIVFTIHPGQHLKQIAGALESQGLVSDALLFTLYARYKKAGTRLPAGEYLLRANLAPVQILEQLVKGKVKLYRLTIPEGLNMDETAALIAEAGFCDTKTFLDLSTDPEFIDHLNIPSHTLEGFLFPETYFFPKTTPCRQVITKMVDTFFTVFTPRWQERTKTLGFTLKEIVTLASMIEKEAGVAFEHPLIASVFHNRLEKKMRMESDPTVIYGDPDFEGRIRTRHLRRKTDYNTYQMHGLPKGPIANPGAKAMEAALFPAQSDYLFFVSKNDSTHHFSKTLAEHNRAVRKYQLNK